MDIKDYTKVLKKYTTLHKYIDGDMMISYYGGYRLKDTDKVIDVLVEGSGYQNTPLILVVRDKNGDIREEEIALFEPPKLFYPPEMWEKAKKNEGFLLYEEMENFYKTTKDERFFKRLLVRNPVNVQQAIDMLEILNQKRKEISFNNCDEEAMIKTILGVSGVFDSDNVKPLMLFNEFLARSDEKPSFTKMLEREEEFEAMLEKQKIKESTPVASIDYFPKQEERESTPVASIIQFPKQKEIYNNDDFGENKQAEIIDISRFKRR